MAPIAVAVSSPPSDISPSLKAKTVPSQPVAAPAAALDDLFSPTTDESFSSRAEDGSYKLLNQPLGTRRKLKVICIGAGPSGINMAYKVQSHLKDMEFVAYEKNPEIGGTWYENRYPGVACDTNSHGYAFTYRLKADWTRVFSSGGEIQEYMQDVVDHFNLRQYFRLSHEVVGARFDPKTAKWTVAVKNDEGILEDTCDVLINGSGLLNHWRWPAIKGLHDFKGTLLHTASWPDGVDLKGKRIGLIGIGSSAIQVLPNIQKDVGSCTVFIRSKTWVAPPREGELLSPQTIERYKDHPEEHLEYCRELESLANKRFGYVFKGSREQKDIYAAWSESMRKELASRPDIYDKVHPEFGVGCRRQVFPSSKVKASLQAPRPTPGPGFLAALQAPNVTAEFEGIDHADATGLVTADGKHHEFDIIICATGFDVSFRPRFPVIGTDGLNLQDHWAKSPTAYLSMFAGPSFPNYVTLLGPGAPSAQGSIIVSIERISDYVVKMLRRMQTEAIKTVAITQEALDEYAEHTQKQLEITVWTDKCSSWFKNGSEDGQVLALHPGGRLHFFALLMDPRWEDFTWSYWNKNRFAYWGNGLTLLEKEGRNDTWYLQYADGLKLFEY